MNIPLLCDLTSMLLWFLQPLGRHLPCLLCVRDSPAVRCLLLQVAYSFKDEVALVEVAHKHNIDAPAVRVFVKAAAGANIGIGKPSAGAPSRLLGCQIPAAIVHPLRGQDWQTLLAAAPYCCHRQCSRAWSLIHAYKHTTAG